MLFWTIQPQYRRFGISHCDFRQKRGKISKKIHARRRREESTTLLPNTSFNERMCFWLDDNRKYGISTTGSRIDAHINSIKIVMLVFYSNYALVYNSDLQYNMILNSRRTVEGEINNDLLTGNNQPLFNWLRLETIKTSHSILHFNM